MFHKPAGSSLYRLRQSGAVLKFYSLPCLCQTFTLFFYFGVTANVQPPKDGIAVVLRARKWVGRENVGCDHGVLLSNFMGFDPSNLIQRVSQQILSKFQVFHPKKIS